MKIKFTWRIWVWIIVLALSILSLFNFSNIFLNGVEIKSVDQNSTAFENGLRNGQIITAIDGEKISNAEDYFRIIQNKNFSGEKVKTTVTTNSGEFVIFSEEQLMITVGELGKTNLKTGLDLSGGARALVKAENYSLTSTEANDLASIVNNRFNAYGISDITVRSVRDLSGNYFMLVEIAGATPDDLENLISQQGKFEGKVGNETIFIGGNQDIKDVGRAGQNAEIYACNQIQSGYVCNFRFTVMISQDSAERMARVTSNLSVVGDSLSKPLDLFLDDNYYSNLSISSGLKGNPVTQISISGAGTGATQDDAIKDAQAEMKRLQTVLLTGSLPFKLEIAKIDTISPTLGNTFTKYILVAGLLALVSVAIIIFIKYRKLKLIIPPLLISTSEIIITLGIAALVKQDLDLPGIAGILAAIGTGIDDQIVVLDEAEHKEELSFKQKIKRAFTIVMGAFFTSAVSLLPLLWAGAGLLKGFAIMSLIGITVGVFITRRAFADMVSIIEEK